jgi:membrane peptidoglycan carboxypeptidase
VSSRPPARRSSTGASRSSRHRGARGFSHFFRRWWWVLVAVPLALVLSFTGTILYVYAHTDLPKAPPAAQTTYVYDRHGKLLGTLHGAFNRTEIPLRAMPRTLRRAILAAEDKGFYHHGAISLTGIVRAAWQDLVHGRVQQGGSTITQQYVKNVYTGNERSILRKLEEAILAVKVEKRYSKNEILAKYLNTIYFGHGAYGVEQASRTYFGHGAKKLALPEAALLA